MVEEGVEHLKGDASVPLSFWPFTDVTYGLLNSAPMPMSVPHDHLHASSSLAVKAHDIKEIAKRPQHHKRGWTITAAVVAVLVGVYLVGSTPPCLLMQLC